MLLNILPMSLVHYIILINLEEEEEKKNEAEKKSLVRVWNKYKKKK